MSDSTFSHNSAIGPKNDFGGGIFNFYDGTVTVTGSTFSGNSAGKGGYGYGGGIQNQGPTVTVSNSTFSNNSTTSGGGGIDNVLSGSMSVSSSTLSNNVAPYGGDVNTESGTITLTATIVANSRTGSNCNGTITDGGYNLDSGSTCHFRLKSDLNKTKPKLGPLADNGGPTQTMALLPGSKAIDWVALSSCPATDQRGYPRPDGSGESTCDIGAYESAY